MNLPGSPAACRVDRVAVNSAATSSQAAAASLSRADGVKSSLAQLADETGGTSVAWSTGWSPRTGAFASSRPPAEPLLAALVDLLLPELSSACPLACMLIESAPFPRVFPSLHE